MNAQSWIAGGSLAVSFTLALWQIHNWWKDSESKRKQEILSSATVDADRDAIIISSAERAVGILERSLRQVSEEADRLRVQLQAAQAEIGELRAEIAAMKKENRNQ